MKLSKKISTFLLCILFLGLSQSCGLVSHLDNQKKGKGYIRQFSTTNNTFQPYVYSFEAHAKNELNDPNFKVVDVPINFGDTENDQFVGVCFTYSNGDKEIIIDKEWWDRVSETAKESLLYHELGHCALNRGHNEDTIEKNNKTIRASVMHPGVVSTMDYNNYKTGYIHELFTADQNLLIQSL